MQEILKLKIIQKLKPLVKNYSLETLKDTPKANSDTAQL